MSEPSYRRWLPASVLKTLGRLEFLAHGTVDGFVSGKHKSARKGASVEFAEHRQYVPGDDLRNLDWKLVARRQRFYIKQYVDETNLRAMVVLDTSGSMGYAGEGASGGLSKLDYARHLAASLAYLLVNQQDAVGFVAYDDKVRSFIPPRAQPTQVRTVLETIDALGPGGETDMAAVLHEIAERVPRRSVVFLISDFYSEPVALLQALHHLRFRHDEVIAIQVIAEEERTFPFERLKRFRDLESSLALDVDARAIRNDYLERFTHHLETVRRGCGEIRIAHELISTAEPFDTALADILVRYRQRGGR